MYAHLDDQTLDGYMQRFGLETLIWPSVDIRVLIVHASIMKWYYMEFIVLTLGQEYGKFMKWLRDLRYYMQVIEIKQVLEAYKWHGTRYKASDLMIWPQRTWLFLIMELMWVKSRDYD